MIIKVYDGTTLYKTYSFVYSDRKQTYAVRHNPLMKSGVTDIYLEKDTGFAVIKLYLTTAQMKQLIELYSLQEAGYELHWVYEGERKVYIVSDFVQKRVGLKSYVDLFEIDVKLEVVSASYLSGNVEFYSNDFDKDCSNVNDFTTNYPNWTLIGSLSDTDLTVNDSYLSINKAPAYNVATGIKEDMTNYSYDNATFIWYNVTPLENSDGWTYIPIRIDMSPDKVYIDYYPSDSNPELKTAFYDNGSWTYGVDTYISIHTKINFKIIKTGNLYACYYDVGSGWTALESHTFTNNNHLSMLYVWTAGIKVKYDKIEVTPDEAKI